jgi:sugar (pentulose or hexulose) kinase
MSDCALGVDVGTSGARAALLAANGELLGLASTSFAALGDDPSSPRVWRRAVLSCIARLRKDCDLVSVAALAVDGTSGTMLAIDGEGEPVGPASMYDEPCEDEANLARIDAAAPLESPARGRTSPLARALAMQDRPKARVVLHQADWLSGLFSGRFDVTDENNALKTGYDVMERRWPAWIARAGMDPGKLPAVLQPGAPVGPICEAAMRLGLPARAVVHAGTTDGCASFLATGASHIGDAVTALGSTLVIKILSDKPISDAASGVYSHRLGDRWLAGGASNSGGKAIRHFLPTADLEALSGALTPDEPLGLHLYPLARPGERFPINDPNLAPRVEPRPAGEAQFLQALLEGVAEIEALAYRRLGELGSPPLRSLRTVGGGAANAAWTRIRQRLIPAPFEPAISSEACVGTAYLLLERLKAA